MIDTILNICMQEIIHAIDKDNYEKKRDELLQKLRDMGLKPLIENEYEIK